MLQMNEVIIVVLKTLYLHFTYVTPLKFLSDEEMMKTFFERKPQQHDISDADFFFFSPSSVLTVSLITRPDVLLQAHPQGYWFSWPLGKHNIQTLS